MLLLRRVISALLISPKWKSFSRKIKSTQLNFDTCGITLLKRSSSGIKLNFMNALASRFIHSSGHNLAAFQHMLITTYYGMWILHCLPRIMQFMFVIRKAGSSGRDPDSLICKNVILLQRHVNNGLYRFRCLPGIM